MIMFGTTTLRVAALCLLHNSIGKTLGLLKSTECPMLLDFPPSTLPSTSPCILRPSAVDGLQLLCIAKGN